jgi:hypothetical protein
MGAALFITLERQIPGIDASSVGGKLLSRNLDWLNEASGKLNVRPLGDLISVNSDEAADFLEGEGMDTGELSIPPEQWFDADEGLKTLGALLLHTESTKPEQKNLLEDLRSCMQVLERAKQNDVRFHFAVDF